MTTETKTVALSSKLLRRRIYQAWRNMINRCEGRGSLTDRRNYFERGIAVHPKWQTYKGFAEDMLPTYRPGLTLERMDNSKGYSPDNCRWATRLEQIRNRRSTPFFTINDETLCIAEWIERSNVKSSTVRQRYYVYKWPIEKALGFEKKEG